MFVYRTFVLEEFAFLNFVFGFVKYLKRIKGLVSIQQSGAAVISHGVLKSL